MGHSDLDLAIHDLDLYRFCAGHLRVYCSFKKTDEMTKHGEEFQREAVRIALTSGLPRKRVAADLDCRR